MRSVRVWRRRPAGRPFLYLQGANTKASGRSKEDQARAIAVRDGITEGLVYVFGGRDRRLWLLVR